MSNMHTVTVTYEVEANSDLHAVMVVKQHLKGKGEVEKTEDTWGFSSIEVKHTHNTIEEHVQCKVCAQRACDATSKDMERVYNSNDNTQE